ncbi:hypothetical protein SARC_01507 [Sphaeroforma arctica JP610]|uniref:Altered inheritance of mitochondria protein 41 n=1 Tax=Sphaeroforma arctica JP610 TaxID=667725 RepID=A0A0L0GDK8_9EUKA|nr:hypothetical protein SARC_01507 [Sphaeroforma arctica JP610]KNC86348.1 hypothetical protein SARC_01507 [Sphaeroforma arctica JP610]|eukprot:XP_014160250.1 hypothetical protein SARC_01507 [Sphaeroforma arctica JP610]
MFKLSSFIARAGSRSYCTAPPTILSTCQNDLKVAMRAKDKFRVQILRSMVSDLKNAQIPTKGQKPATEAQVLQKGVASRRESIIPFKSAGRQDLVDKEVQEIAVIMEYLPKQLSTEEVNALVSAAIKEVNAESPRDMGKIMKYISSNADPSTYTSAAIALAAKELLSA